MQPALSFLGSFPYSDAYVLSEVIVIESQVVRPPVHIPSEEWLTQGPFLKVFWWGKSVQLLSGQCIPVTVPSFGTLSPQCELLAVPWPLSCVWGIDLPVSRCYRPGSTRLEGAVSPIMRYQVRFERVTVTGITPVLWKLGLVSHCTAPPAYKCGKNTQMPGVGPAAIINGFRDPVDWLADVMVVERWLMHFRFK